MAIPSQVIEDIKYHTDIESVISSYIVLKRAGKNLVGLCPFHGEKTPSFTVYPENGSFYCFGCKVGGNVFTFIQNIENLDYIESVRLLADRAGIVIPETGYDNSFVALKNRLYEINREAARFYNSFMSRPEGKWAYDYYVSRGLTPATIRSFGLGAAPDSWDALLRHLKGLGYTEEEMLQANVVTKNKNGGYLDRFRNRAMFPIINVRGNIIGFSGRRRGENKEEAKYINTSDTPVYKKSQNLFGLNLAKSYCSESLILVEGNLDVISLHQAGFKNVVCPLGTAFTSEQAMLITRYTEEVIICFDSDEAGQTAIMKAIDIFAKTGIKVKITLLPDGKDPDEFLKKNPPPEFKKLIDAAVDPTRFKLLRAGDAVDTESDNAKLNYLNEAVEILAKTTDPIAVDYYITKLADEHRVSKDAIRMKIQELRRKRVQKEERRVIREMAHPTFDRNDINPERRGNERAVQAEEIILSILMKHPDLASTIKRHVEEIPFVSSLNSRLLNELLKVLEIHQTFDISYVSQSFSDQEMGYISRLLNTGYNDNNPKTALAECFKAIKTERLLSATPDDSDDWAAQLSRIAENKKGK